MTSVDNQTLTRTPIAQLFLPVDERMFIRPFEKVQATNGELLSALRDRVQDSAKPAFDRGVTSLKSGDYAKAENSLKQAISPEVDSMPAFVYLAATYAASGHDTEAASAWQTALIDGSDFPELYLWLGDALLRTRDLAQARSILEEGVAKWPGDVRFAKPLALVYATFGNGLEAVRTLERHLDERPDDVEAYGLGVEWMYHLHAAGAVAHSSGEDLKRARSWAERYTKSKGVRSALVRQWLEYLERP